ncbi:MAG: transposase [Clostridia bacterium]|nr:transposase [Clostridia bacterium]
MHPGRQNKHIEGTSNYKRQKANGKKPSILTDNPNKMLLEGAGKGTNYGNKEVIDYGRVVGKFYDTKSNQYYDTTRATIHYDTKGNAHIVPAAPRGFKR